MTQKVAAHKMLQRQKTKPEEFEHLVSSVLTPIKILGENQKLWQVDYKIYALKLFILVVIIALFNLLCSFNPSTAMAQNNERSDKVVRTIEQENQDLCQNSDSNDCELLQYKYCKMGDSAFPFYRATNYLFWNDFSKDERLQKFGNDKTKTWILGDLHVDNFGTFDNSQEDIVFNMNDFDESVIADYQYDVWRMAASIVLVARNPEMDIFSQNREKQEQIIDAFTESYLDTIASYHGNDKEIKTNFTLDSLGFNLNELLDQNRVKNNPKKARKKMLEKWTNEEGDKLANQKKIDEKKLAIIDLDSDLYQEIKKAISDYSKSLAKKFDDKPAHFKVKDIAQRLGAGLGSLGTSRYYVLIEGESTKPSDDRILDVKRQSKPTAYAFLGSAWQKEYDRHFSNDAQRQAIAYRALIKDADAYLGWIELSDSVYSIRERSPFKDSILTTNLNKEKAFTNMAKLWGKILATDHARADKDFDSELIPYSFDKQVDNLTDGHHKEFRALVRQIAFEYADRVQADYEAFEAALKPDKCPEVE